MGKGCRLGSVAKLLTLQTWLKLIPDQSVKKGCRLGSVAKLSIWHAGALVSFFLG